VLEVRGGHLQNRSASTTTYEPNPDIVSTQLDSEESVLLSLKAHKYYMINETGSVIRNGLTEGKTSDEIADTLSTDFEIEKDDEITHVEEFITRLPSDDIITER
jgi:hypothetical protein